MKAYNIPMKNMTLFQGKKYPSPKSFEKVDVASHRGGESEINVLGAPTSRFCRVEPNEEDENDN